MADRVTGAIDNGAAVSYSYDDTNQLTADGAASYSYDANGNRTMAGYATSTGNRTTNDGTWTYTFDDAGNEIKKSRGASAETWNYLYDNRNQLIAAEQHATDGGVAAAESSTPWSIAETPRLPQSKNPKAATNHKRSDIRKRSAGGDPNARPEWQM